MRTLSLLTAMAVLFGTASASEVITYTYDANGRLTKVERARTSSDDVKSEYKYDDADNRTELKITVPA